VLVFSNHGGVITVLTVVPLLLLDRIDDWIDGKGMQREALPEGATGCH
jgi:hypothetical protein